MEHHQSSSVVGTVDGILKPKAGKQLEDGPEAPPVELGVGAEAVEETIEGEGEDTAGVVIEGAVKGLVGVEDGTAVDGELGGLLWPGLQLLGSGLAETRHKETKKRMMVYRE